jgi:hypothetical protein
LKFLDLKFLDLKFLDLESPCPAGGKG